MIPAYNESGRLPATLRRIREYLDASGVVHEIVVVDDGSSDGTAERALEAGYGDHVAKPIQILHLVAIMTRLAAR